MPTKVEKDALTGQYTTGHEWDGIKELNNPLPKWWLYTFYVSIAIAFVYFVLYPSIPWGTGYFKGLLGTNQRLVLEEQMQQVASRQSAQRAAIAEADMQTIVADSDLLQLATAGGEAAYADNCAACHGLGGAGQAGGYPVLADDAWIWGGSLEAIHTTLLHGIRSDVDDLTRWSEMPAYGELGILDRAQIEDVAHYVYTLNGRDALDADAAQRGAETFEIECSACHGVSGEGLREVGGPTLNDRIWLYGGEQAEIAAQIAGPKHGVMPAFGNRLDAETIKMLTVYVHGLGGGE